MSIYLNEFAKLIIPYRASRFSEQKSSGLSARQWCAQNGFSIYAYNYWKHRKLSSMSTAHQNTLQGLRGVLHIFLYLEKAKILS